MAEGHKCQPSGPQKLQEYSVTSPPASQEATALKPRLGRREVTSSEAAAWRRPHLLAVVPVLAGATDEALVAPLASGALRLGEGLLEGMLLGVHLVVQELGRQLRPIVDLNLRGARQWSPHRWGAQACTTLLSHTAAWGLLPDPPLECHHQERRAWGLLP